jgi:opine dehydrogenase
MANYLEEGQIIILNPGRTCGAIEFRNGLKMKELKKYIYIAEAQTLIYACRIVEPGTVNIIGIKEKVMLSALPASDTSFVLEELKKLYTCFIPAKNVLVTSLENIGAIFHPCIILFNAASIERGNMFFFYRDMTDRVASFIEAFDAERLAVGKAYGIDLISAKEWISFAYNGVKGDTLLEKMRNNQAYFNITAPTNLESRQLLEDIPTGIIPMFNLGEIAGVDMPLFKSVISICSTLLNKDFYLEGRTLDKFGIKSVEDLFNIITS